MHTLYTVARTDGDNRSINLTEAEAAVEICRIAWGCDRAASTRSDAEIIGLAFRMEIRAECQPMGRYLTQLTDLRDRAQTAVDADEDDADARGERDYFSRLLAEAGGGQ